MSLWLNFPVLLLASPLWFWSGGLGNPPFPIGRYCRECGDRINFLGLVSWAILLLGSVILALILLT